MHLILKHLNAISVLLLLVSGVLISGLTIASAENDVNDFCDAYKFNSASLTEEIFEQAGVNIDLEFKNVFGGTPEEPEITDLYLSLYRSIQESPSDAALEQTAEANQMTQIELCSIFGGNYQLLSTIYDETYNNDDLIEEVDSLATQYEEAFEKSIRDQAEFLKLYPHEVFVNGDTSDSGFDVLYDLAIIEYILFGEESSIGSGGSLGMGSWNDDDDEDEDEEGSADVEIEAEDVPDEESETAEESEEEESEAETAEEETEEEDATVEPAECAADTELQDAFADAGVVVEDPAEEEASDDGDAEGDEDDDTSDSDDGDGDSDSAESDPADILLTLPETESNWETPHLCSSVFCLVIEFRNKDAVRYEETSNCVKCHVDYIVESLDKTTSVSLNPGKLSGNLMEPGLCKRSLTGGKINLTFVAIPMPIRTPPPDDIISKTNFWENFEDFVKDTWDVDEAEQFVNADTFGAGGYDRDGSEATETTEEEEESDYKFMSFFDRLYGDAVKQETNMDDGTISNAEMLENALSNYDSQIAEIEEQFDKMQSYARASASKDFYQNLQYEMNQMVFYFSSYQTLIGLTQEVVNDLKNNLNKVE